MAASTSGAIGAKPAADSTARRGRLRGEPDRRDERRERQRREGMFHGIQYILNLYRGFRACVSVFICPAACWPRCSSWRSAASAAAQTGRVGGVVKDEAGQPIKGATVTAENPGASPSSFTATTDDKGRFSIIGLKTGPVDVHRAGARASRPKPAS